MSSQEFYFTTQSRYPKVSGTAMPVDAVEEWLNQFPHKRVENKPNGGIIRSIAEINPMLLREMSAKERKKAVAQAQFEHRQAIRNLAKQDAQDAKEISKQLVAWRREDCKPKRTTEMKTERGQEFLDHLKAKRIYHVKNFEKSKNYLQVIVREARALGYQIEPVRKSVAIVSYKLKGHKKP